MRKVLTFFGLLALSLAFVACAAKPAKITFWNIGTAASDKAYWADIVSKYEKLHPNVTIDNVALENEAFKSKLTTVMQSGNPPDIFQSWGGGVMTEYAKAGLLRDISKQVLGTAWGNSMSPGVLGVYQYDGKQYGLPYDMGAVAFWYNKDLLAKVGYQTFPTTWQDLLTLVKKLKAAGITPIALGGGDKWPAMYYYTYLAIRLGGKAELDGIVAGTNKFTDQPFIKAGQMLAELNSLKPFQSGFLAATYPDEGGLMGNGMAATELMGQWAPNVEADSSTSKKGIGDKLAIAPFPSVEGGVGQGTDVMGGGNGYAVGKNASDTAVDFLKFITNKDNNTTYAETGNIIPVVAGADVGIKDPNMKSVKALVDKATYYQLYLDQFFSPAVGGAINDSVQKILAGTMTPEQAAAAIEQVYETNK